MATLVPEPGGFDDDLYFIHCDFGQFGQAFVERSPERISREALIREIISGEHERPLRVLALNPEKGWSRDVSQEIARAVAAKLSEDDALPEGVRDFLDEQLSRHAA